MPSIPLLCGPTTGTTVLPRNSSETLCGKQSGKMEIMKCEI